MAPSVMAMAKELEKSTLPVLTQTNAPGLGSAPESGFAQRLESHHVGKLSSSGALKEKRGESERSLESACSTDLLEALAPQRMMESTSWEHHGQTSAPLKPAQKISAALGEPPAESDSIGRMFSDSLGVSGYQQVKVREVKGQGHSMPRPQSGSQFPATRRMMSHHASNEPRSFNRALFNRQWSHMSSGTEANDSKRRSSFTKQLLNFRGESQDSLVSQASEPISYSNKLYLASDIWLTEKKLDNVEGDIRNREEEKVRRRGKPRRDVHDVFGRESESQNFSSRLVGLLWSNPVTANPAVPSRSNLERKESRRNGPVQRRDHGPERGALGINGKFAPKAMHHMADNMPGAMPHVNSTLHNESSATQTKDELEFIKLQTSCHRQRGYYVKELARKADPVRWYRRHVMKRAERFDIY